tara:strand:- start:571 stop:1263 length:693 start_codon:yes stop_codon:yes gene_type:complete
MLKAIVRVNIGKHDTYRKDEYSNSDWEKITFTDLAEREYRKWSGDKETSTITINDYMFPEKNLSNKRKSSFLGITALTAIKDLASVDYDLVVWLAGDACIIGDMNEFVDKVHKGDVSAPVHPDCINASEDGQKIINYNKDSYASIVKTLKHYKYAGFSQNNGYHETSGLIKSNTQYSRDLESVWAAEYLNASTHRDQLVLPFARWVCSDDEANDGRFNGYSKKEQNGYLK